MAFNNKSGLLRPNQYPTALRNAWEGYPFSPALELPAGVEGVAILQQEARCVCIGV